MYNAGILKDSRFENMLQIKCHNINELRCKILIINVFNRVKQNQNACKYMKQT